MTLESYLTGKYPYYDPRVVIYERKMFIRLATVQNSYIFDAPIPATPTPTT